MGQPGASAGGEERGPGNPAQVLPSRLGGDLSHPAWHLATPDPMPSSSPPPLLPQPLTPQASRILLSPLQGSSPAARRQPMPSASL